MAKAKFSASGYRKQWKSWVNDPLIKSHGITFDRTPADDIKAPPGKFRVCAYHVDFDERPTLFMDVGSLAEAKFVIEEFYKIARGKNVDFGVVYDDTGNTVASNCPY